ncbi:MULTISPECIES: alpha/beta hydrolase [Flavobacterium]|jgi:pimeloyl-ACP methyl ester carboxylesterase|uniref:Alpha/beta hydrolase n=1 Tax=Flavobacterium cupriresistens TaxID=2893885 RepID=A0ABU4RD33_9FLAO|nr:MULTISPECIES: alpha/beta hydrolase [unclassified Flavobacterium]KLT70872.1 alpha/beta hydrolase [Flavobacterium sp. ABG]MDX6189903.1 alpha/beta hydrolase [Flavobacterium sp. Fl-318]UFH42728.1 alpha/beta hydrolase [Flavobacterium sp. F-323]
MSKIPVYFMPGLAASSSIFERIQLDDSVFEVCLLEWEIPLPKESLSEYALRITKKITHPNPVLIGVSFGGILVQEMARHINARKIIIISSVRSNLEFPKRMKIGKTTKAYKLIPMQLLLNVEKLAKFSFGEKINKRIKLYEKFLSVRDLHYLQWAVESVILWDRNQIDEKVIHIHGDQDDVFPIKYIKSCIIVKGGTHVMILNKYKWLNENLPLIIQEPLKG